MKQLKKNNTNTKFLNYEHKSETLAPLKVFYKRVLKNLVIASVILIICLLIGIFGYHYFGKIGWLDSVHNASMILSGMGPVATIDTVAGKWFSSFYALFSGVVFITNISFVLAPAAHRFFHKLHIQEK
ncbi:MAG TPA: hypothetical protein VIM07_16770 [Chitinophagaceae bacterium]